MLICVLQLGDISQERREANVMKWDRWFGWWIDPLSNK